MAAYVGCGSAEIILGPGSESGTFAALRGVVIDY